VHATDRWWTLEAPLTNQSCEAGQRLRIIVLEGPGISIFLYTHTYLDPSYGQSPELTPAYAANIRRTTPWINHDHLSGAQ
jgi:hypothetical protein